MFRNIKTNWQLKTTFLRRKKGKLPVRMNIDTSFLKMLQYVVLALLVVPHPTCLLFHIHLFRLFPHSLSSICMVVSG